MKLIAGSSNRPLTKELADALGSSLIETEITKFANDEKRVRLKEDVQGDTVILLQSFSEPVDEHIIEFLLLSDALERAGARHVHAVIPWYGYSLQDKVFRSREALSAKVIANLVSNAHVKRTYLLDVHNTSLAGFFSVPTHHLTALDLFADYVQDNFGLEKTVIASPDFGGLKRAWVFAKKLNLPWVNLDKRRDPQTGEIEQMEIHGEVTDKKVIVFDDVIVSGSTVIEAAKVLKAAGATEVHFLATHGLLVAAAVEKLSTSEIDSVVMTNSVNHEELPDKFKVISCASLFAEKLQGWM